MTIEQLGTIVGIVSAVSAGIIYLIRQLRKYQHKFREKVTSSWGNEGDITKCKNETFFIDLELIADKEDGEIRGILNIRNVTNDDVFNNISVNGKMLFRTVKVKFSVVRQGELIILGTAKLTIKGKLLHWKLLKGDKSIFPIQVVLFKSLPHII